MSASLLLTSQPETLIVHKRKEKQERMGGQTEKNMGHEKREENSGPDAAPLVHCTRYNRVGQDGFQRTKGKRM